MDEEIEFSPFISDAFKYGLKLTRRVDIERHEDIGIERPRQRFDMLLRLVVEIGDRHLRAQRTERLGAAPGYRLVVGDADDEALLMLQQFRLNAGDHALLDVHKDI